MATPTGTAPWILRPIRPSDDEAVAAIIRTVMTEHGASGPGFAIHDAEVLAMIRAGREPGAADNRSGVAMPASGGRPDLTDQQLAAIIGYIRNGLPKK